MTVYLTTVIMINVFLDRSSISLHLLLLNLLPTTDSIRRVLIRGYIRCLDTNTFLLLKGYPRSMPHERRKPP